MTATTTPASARPVAGIASPRFPGAGMVGGSLLVVYLLLFLFGSRLAPFRATELAGLGLQPPGGRSLLGTNLLGQDVASQLVLGARASLLVAAISGVGTLLIGGTIGVVAGWFRGWTDAVLMRATDVVLVLPRLPLLLLVGALTGGSVVALSIGISAAFWPTTARVLRSQVLTLRSRAHVRAAAGFGAGSWHQLRRHILPDLALLSIAEFIPAASRGITLQAALSFLGVGDPSRPSWGSMIRDAVNFSALFLTDAWKWWLVPPVVALVGLITAITLVGTAAERRLAPRVARHQR